MKIAITMDLDDEYADPGHEMGITGEGYDRLTETLAEFGENIDVRRATT
jgi:hypothetical protein